MSKAKLKTNFAKNRDLLYIFGLDLYPDSGQQTLYVTNMNNMS